MRRLVVALVGLTIAVVAIAARAERTLPDYRYFRALSIDLVGRAPTYDEVAAFEKPDFDLDAWVSQRLTAGAYADRMRSIYMDALRLEVGPAFPFVPSAVVLRRIPIIGPDGLAVNIYFRRGQRRVAPALDGDFCFTSNETGLQTIPNTAPVGVGTPVSKALLEERTVLVKPWWLYADHRNAAPSDRYGPNWSTRFPGFIPVPGLLVEPDGTSATTSVRVCREETGTAEFGAVYASGRASPKRSVPLPAGRFTQPPGDSGFARANKGRAVSCLTGTGYSNSIECGCGVGLERCMPSAGSTYEPNAFAIPTVTPLGTETAFEMANRPGSAWARMWWAEEFRHFFDRIIVDDRDFRELLTSRATEINGPLGQFYRFFAGATCCGPLAELGYTQPESLFEPNAVPDALVPVDVDRWMSVPDRGPRASGILTMPVFLTKYGSRRARAHVLYSAFLCKDFVADTVKLEPSNEPDLTKRAGCATCHQTLEPMAAYFSRVTESDWTYLPPTQFPLSLPKCVKGDKMSGPCRAAYDPIFGSLRGGYAAPAHVDTGPAGLAAEIVSAREFAPCVVKTVAESLLGRQLEREDDEWKAVLVRSFIDGGYRMRNLVRTILKSPRYRDTNDVKR